ncbi:MAG TPA: molybdenum transporter [Flavobacteriales bacterium]|nr:molybdenum transporter [Flavobacteriales bacterium]
MKYKVKNRIWLEGDNGTFLGNGRIELLYHIHHTGSIKKAAKKLKMSYRKAWSLLDSMNKQAKEVYLIKSSGGSGGGGTEVTEAGLRAIENFKKLDQKCQHFLNEELKKMDF